MIAAFLARCWAPILIAVLVLAGYADLRLKDRRIQQAEQAAATAHLQAQQLQATNTTLEVQLAQQNAAVQALQAKGREAQEVIDGLVQEAQHNAAQVETRYQTKYVPVPVPAGNCRAAVAAGARNMAQIGSIYQGTPR